MPKTNYDFIKKKIEKRLRVVKAFKPNVTVKPIHP